MDEPIQAQARLTMFINVFTLPWHLSFGAVYWSNHTNRMGDQWVAASNSPDRRRIYSCAHWHGILFEDSNPTGTET